MQTPLVTIITVNYEHSDVTCELLQSLSKIQYRNIEIIVVDNASKKDNPEYMLRAFPHIQLIRSTENLGFAGGNNLGIKQSKGDYLLFINNDTEVEPNFLGPMVNFLEQHPEIGAISPKIHFYHQPNTIQYAGHSPMNHWTMRSHSIGWNQADKGEYNDICETNFVHGAAMMVPRRVIEKVGMMSESYFLYYEEFDWATRMLRAGYRLYYFGPSLILHKESVSTGKFSPFKTYYMNRSRWLYLRRNVHGFPALIAWMYQAFISIPKNCISYLMRGQFEHVKAYIKALTWHFKHLRDSDIYTNPSL